MISENIKLRDFSWQIGYSSDECDLVKYFYEPAMAAAVCYDRAVGYFSSSALALISNGIQNLYLRNGQMRLIASPVMSVADCEAIKKGYKKRAETIEKCLLQYLDPDRLSSDETCRLQLLTGMIADGLLEVKIAVKEEEDGSLNLYHEKIGVFVDSSNDFISFIGSPNESWNGWVGNAESFALHKSWDHGTEYANWNSDLFNRTWGEGRDRLSVYKFPDAIREALFKKFPPREPDDPQNVHRLSCIHARARKRQPFRMPDWLDGGEKLHGFQRDAVNRWLEAEGRGIFAMATGTGKTVTALVAAIQVAKEHGSKKVPLLILVVVPSADLVTQWDKNAQEFGFFPVTCHSDTANDWPKHVKVLLNGLSASTDGAAEMIVVTAGTLVTPRFQEMIRRYKGNMLVIGDEMHSLGTPRRRRSLPAAQFRMGLSATPRRHGDEEGTSQLIDYFGDVLQRIDIRKAIDLKALVPYRYDPVIVSFDHLEMDRYKELSAKIAMLHAASSDFDDFVARAGPLLLERARLIGHAQSKLPELRRVIEKFSSERHSLVYAAEDTHPIYETRQIDEIVSLLGNQLKMSVNKYTSETTRDQRKSFQEMLRDGRLQALIAMRCLDEGIDIPEARRGFMLASTQNPRQFVQRRGRILRRDDKGGKTHAELYDFLVVPEETPPKDHPTFSLERRLVGRELTRSLELASASENWYETPPTVLIDVMARYDLLELVADYNEPANWDAGGDNVYDY
jgi:superfamily II DNA or RNA helicase